ncbi:MAG TPA: hypothetical protein H9826_04985 [Candidatus Intestinimonas merdavium]|uniref:Uncharacterized protein n=1 Tax=Candidatus Intestinimonas merdavium TaxID=2838622 RepID=A0A9D1Z4L8_9FIRM|nr:hypothetical protein [Candidatus Intestinimonas merdavium]
MAYTAKKKKSSADTSKPKKSSSSSSSSSSGSYAAGAGVYTPSKNQGARFDGPYDDVADRPLDDTYYQKQQQYQSMYDAARQKALQGDASAVTDMRNANDWMNQVRNDYGLAAQYANDDIGYVKSLIGYYGGGSSSGSGSSGGGSYGGGSYGGDFSYGDAPEYLSRWDDALTALAGQLMSRPAFSYDYTQDPLYQQYREVYTREGDRAMRDTLGQVSARTGGLASSYAASAASQANNYYMAQLSDIIPQLEQLAYQRYLGQGEALMDQLQAVQALEAGDYARYQDALGQWNTDRAFAYNAWSDARDFSYAAGRDQLSDQRYARELAYQQARDGYGEGLDRAALLASVGDYSGYAGLWGLSDEQTQALIDAYAGERALSDRDAAMALADWKAQYGDFSGLTALGVDTGYLEAQRLAELAESAGSGSSGGSSARSSWSSARSSGSTSSASAGESGIVDTMLALGDEVKAYEYLLNQGYTVSATEQLWSMYQAAAAQAEENRYNDSYFRAAMTSLAAQLQQDPNAALGGLDDLWTKLSPSQKNQVQALLGRFGYRYEE